MPASDTFVTADGGLADAKAAQALINLYSVKPVNQATLAAAATGGRLVIAEDH